MSLRKLRSTRSMHRFEKKWLVWNHGNWTKEDRKLRRAERRQTKQLYRRGF